MDRMELLERNIVKAVRRVLWRGMERRRPLVPRYELLLLRPRSARTPRAFLGRVGCVLVSWPSRERTVSWKHLAFCELAGSPLETYNGLQVRFL